MSVVSEACEAKKRFRSLAYGFSRLRYTEKCAQRINETYPPVGQSVDMLKMIRVYVIHAGSSTLMSQFLMHPDQRIQILRETRGIQSQQMDRIQDHLPRFNYFSLEEE